MRSLALLLVTLGLIGVAYAISNKKIFNVKDYGAKGDGSNDDTEAVRDAIEDARLWLENNPDKKAIIYFPEGVYLVKQFKIYSNMVLKGDGMDRTKLVRFVDRNNLPDEQTYVYSKVGSGWAYYSDLWDSGVFTHYEDIPSNYIDKAEYAKAFITNYDFDDFKTDHLHKDKNIGIFDMTINGNRYLFTIPSKPLKDSDPKIYRYGEKHQLVRFENVDGIDIDNVRFEDATSSHLSIKHSSNVNIGYVEVDGDTERRNPPIRPSIESIDPNDASQWGIWSYEQGGLTLWSVQHAKVDTVISYYAADDSVAIGPAFNQDYARDTFDIKINTLIVYRQAFAHAIVIFPSQRYNTYDITIDTIKYYGTDELHRSGIMIHYPNYRWVEDNGIGVVHDITINNIEMYTWAESYKNSIVITSRPIEDANAGKYHGVNRFYNISIGRIYIDYNIPEGYSKWERGIEISGVNNLTIGVIESRNKHQYGADIWIKYSDNVNILDAYIKRANYVDLKSALIRIDNSSNINIYKFKVPLLDNGNKQANSALAVYGNTSNVLLQYEMLEGVNNTIWYNPDVPEENKQTIEVIQI